MPGTGGLRHDIGLVNRRGMSRARFLRLLEAAEYLAAHSRGSRPDRPVPRRRHPDPHVRLFHLSCGAEYAAGGESARPRRVIEHAYLQFGREAQVALGLPPVCTRMPCCRSAIRWVGSGQCAASLLPMSSMKIAGASLKGAAPFDALYSC